MKAERRHELQENELAKDLGKAEVYVREHFKTVLMGIALLVLVIALILVIIHNRRTARSIELQNFYGYSDRPAGDAEARLALRTLAGETGDDELAAWAWTQAGMMAYEDLVARYGELSSEQREQLAAEAAQALQAGLAEAGDLPSAAARAQLGLGLLAEMRGELDAAEGHYRSAIALSASAPVSAGRASERLDRLSQLAEPLNLPTTAPAAPEAPEAPAEMPAAPEAPGE